MLLAEALSGIQLIFLGGLLLVVSFVLRRSATRGKRQKVRDPIREIQEDFRQTEASYASRLNKFEIRMHEFSRDMEARLQTRIGILDQLVVDADHEIQRLESLLIESRRLESPRLESPSSMTQRPGPDSMTFPMPSPSGMTVPRAPQAATGDPVLDSIYALDDSGMSPQQIATELGQSVPRIALLLKLRRATGKSDAA